jgi:hypothetical protein
MNEEKHRVPEWILLIILFALLIYPGVVRVSRFLTWAECPRAGSLAELSDHGRFLRMASDEKVFEQATEAEASKDDQRLNELLRSEKLFLIPKGTKVQVLEVGWTKVKIKVLEGIYMNRVGLVPMGWVKAR